MGPQSPVVCPRHRNRLIAIRRAAPPTRKVLNRQWRTLSESGNYRFLKINKYKFHRPARFVCPFPLSVEKFFESQVAAQETAFKNWPESLIRLEKQTEHESRTLRTVVSSKWPMFPKLVLGTQWVWFLEMVVTNCSVFCSGLWSQSQ